MKEEELYRTLQRARKRELCSDNCCIYYRGQVKGLPQQAEVAQGVPGRLRSQIFLTFGTTRMIGGEPYAPAAFTPDENPWYSFLEAELTPGHMVLSATTEKIPSVTTGNRSRDLPTSSAVP
jgi:hypothetical protein